jgi:UDP-glucose 4-epimerase
MNILVTGGAGYIGSHVVEELCNAGEHVVVFDNLYTGHREAVDPRAKFVLGDLKDAGAVGRLFDEHSFDGVMHFASYTLVGEACSNRFVSRRQRTNALNLFRAMVDHGVKKFILSSTANLFEAPERVPIDENERIVPGSPYGESKFIIERMLYGWIVFTACIMRRCATSMQRASRRAARGEDHLPETHLIR